MSDPARRPGPHPLTRGWPTAIIRSVLAVVILALTAEVIALLAYLGGDGRDGSLLAIRVGGLLFYAFHRVGVVFDAPQGELFGTGNTLVVAAMGGTVAAGWLLARAGRAIGEEVGGSPIARGLHGVKIAIPYALICFAGSFLIRFRLPVPELGRFEVHPAHLAALLWPLSLGAIFGFAGAFLFGAPTSPWSRRLRGALAGGWRMMLLALALSFAGLLILAAARPRVTRYYLEWAFADGASTGASVLLVHAAVAPNVASWILFSSMGGCLSLSGGPESVCLLSYTAFPTGSGLNVSDVAAWAVRAPGPDLPPPEPGLFLFVLVPAAATVVGGWRASRRAGTADRMEAWGIGALAGVAFALVAIPVTVLASVVLQLSGTIGATLSPGGPLRIGPDAGSGVLLALLWGVGGGGIGGLVGGRSARAGDSGHPEERQEPVGGGGEVPPMAGG